MSYVQWIPEQEAAKKVNRTPRVLRRLVKSGRWPIEYTAPNSRGYQYSEKSINKFLLQNSSVKS